MSNPTTEEQVVSSLLEAIDIAESRCMDTGERQYVYRVKGTRANWYVTEDASPYAEYELELDGEDVLLTYCKDLSELSRTTMR